MFESPVIIGALAAFSLFSSPQPTNPAAADMDRLRDLAGGWVVIDSEGEPTGLTASYQVLAGRAAVLERLLEGTPEETATVYHLENGTITATHLNARCSPARLGSFEVSKKQPGKSPGDYSLNFEEVPSETPRPPGQLTALQLTREDGDRLRIQWVLEPDGERGNLRSFALRRQASLQELGAAAERLRVDLESLRRTLDAHLKRELVVQGEEARPRVLLETRTQPGGPGWEVHGVPFRQFLHADTVLFSTTFASQGDGGHTVAHYPFEAGRDCHLRFSVLGGHAYFCVVEETKKPPRKIKSIPDFSVDLGGGTYGTIVETVSAGRWSDQPRAFDWDLSKYAGKTLRLYIVDAVSNHFGQIAISELRITEERRD